MIPAVLKNLVASEKAIFVGLFFCVPLTILTALGHVGIDAWRSDMLWAVGIFVAGKSIQSVGAGIASKRTPAAANAKVDPDTKPVA